MSIFEINGDDVEAVGFGYFTQTVTGEIPYHDRPERPDDLRDFSGSIFRSDDWMFVVAEDERSARSFLSLDEMDEINL